MTQEILERTAAMSLFLASARYLGIDTAKLLRNLPPHAPYSLPPPTEREKQLLQSALRTAIDAFGIEMPTP